MKQFFLSLLVLCFVLSSSVFAEDYSTRAEDLGPALSVSAATYTDFISNQPDEDLDLDTAKNKTCIKITADLSENVRAHVLLKLIHYFKENGSTDVVNKTDLEKWLNQAYIEIHDIEGVPMAFIVGKHWVAFGANVNKMPTPENSPLFLDGLYDEVFGFTVSLEEVPFFDLVEVSGFETEGGDLSIGDYYGASVRLTKDITDKLKAKVSHLHANNEDLDNTNSTSVGLIFADGTWTGWFEGIYLDGSKQYPDSGFGMTTGVSKKFEAGTVAVEIAYIENSLIQYGIGFLFDIVENVQVAPEIRYNDYEDGRENDWQVAVRVIMKFKSK